jgi:predicted acylesterase/phospholipase RssA
MTAIETPQPPTSPPPSAIPAPPSPPPRKRRVGRIVGWSLFAVVAILLVAESWVIRGALALAVLAAVAIGKSRARPLLPILVAVGGVGAILYVVGSHSWAMDGVAVGAAIAVAVAVAILWRRLRPGRGAGWMAVAVGFVLAWWVSLTVVDTLVMRRAARRDWGTGLSTCPEGLTRPEWGQLRAPRVAVAVSGGGYRAALFHAGVLAGLTCIRVPVTALSTVSGGSIIGAYYAVGGEPHAFRSMAAAGLFNVKRELLHVPNTLRFAWSFVMDLVGQDHPDTRFTQTDVQASMVDRLLYRGLRMADLDSIGDPRLLVNVTDLVSSERLAITARGVLQPISYDPVNRQDYANRTGLVGYFGEYAAFRESVAEGWPANARLSRIVAASGAFPGAMRPVAVYAPKEVSLDTSQAGWYVMADGGIADNTGLASIRDAIGLARDYAIYKRCASPLGADSVAIEARCGGKPPGVSPALEPWLLDVVVMSDGSAMTKMSTPTTTLAELASTADVMYRMSGPQRPPPEDTTVAQTPVLLLSPKAFQRDASDSAYWATPLESTPREAHRGYRSLHLWSYDLDLGTIRFMIAHMMEPDYTRANEALKVVSEEGRIRDGRWRGAVDETGPSQAERALHDALRAELRRRIAVFSSTSTLRDQIDPDTVDSLFLLGKYLALINRQSLHEQIARAVYPRAWDKAPETGVPN